jgi:hypothetical protein
MTSKHSSNTRRMTRRIGVTSLHTDAATPSFSPPMLPLSLSLYRLALLACLCLLSFSPVAAQDPCSGESLAAYQACLDKHPCECSTCDYNPTDAFPTYNVKEPESCQDLMRIMCPFVRCCSLCADEAKLFFTCSSDTVANIFFDSTCPIQCSGYEYGDKVCSPTSSPTMEPTYFTTDQPTASTGMPTHSDKVAEASEQAQVETLGTQSPTAGPVEATTTDKETPQVAAASVEVRQASGAGQPRVTVLTSIQTAILVIVGLVLI